MEQREKTLRLEALLEEFKSLDEDLDENQERLRAIFGEGSLLVDKLEKPEKWAAFRFKYAQFSETADPYAALVAYREAYSALDPKRNRDMAIECRRCMGLLIIRSEQITSADREEAIDHLEAALEDYPEVAVWLAVLFEFRVAGDPWENWKKRYHYYKLEAENASKIKNPRRWARAQNQLGITCEEEPDANFDSALKQRIKHHHAALECLASEKEPHSHAWIRTRLYLSECYLVAPGEETEENILLADKYSRDALEACRHDHGHELLVECLLGRVRIFLCSKFCKSRKKLEEGLQLCDKAARHLDPVRNHSLGGSLESFRANIYLGLIQLGYYGFTKELIQHGERAVVLLEGDEHTRNRRIILQSVAKGLVAAKDYQQAIRFLRRALNLAEIALGRAETIAARMERIWEFRDSSGLLSWCLIHVGKIEEAIIELDRGKSRFWRPNPKPLGIDEIKKLIPVGGALLFGNHAENPGFVILMTEKGTSVARLPYFGYSGLMELQRGDAEGEGPTLGSWLRAYNFRNSQPKKWQQCILDTGNQLYRDFWQPVLKELAKYGVTSGAELVWFPQGGSNIFPVHAAWASSKVGDEKQWLLDKYTFRYAPSLRSLLSKSKLPSSEGAGEELLLITNPRGDLDFSELESVWVRKAVGPENGPNGHGGKLTVLQGEEATSKKVLASLVPAETMHFSGHAFFDLNHPLDSAFLLAGEEKITLKEMIPQLEKWHLKTVILSACETGMSRVTSTPDESLGFPAAFLHSGSMIVISTLWPVDDKAAALLMGRYYHELSASGSKPSTALRAAQLWLRSVTAKQLRVLMREFKGEPLPAGSVASKFSLELRMMPKDHCPYEEPYFWAPFTISGRY